MELRDRGGTLVIARILPRRTRLERMGTGGRHRVVVASADLLAVVRRWHGEARTVLAVLHDMELVREHFPQALLLAREPVAWGPTAQVLRAENLFRARQMAERWDETAPVCERAPS